MTALLKSYEEEYHEITKRISDELSALQAALQRGSAEYTVPPASGPASRQQRCTNLFNLILQIKDLILNMSYECSDLPMVLQTTYKERIEQFKGDTRNLERSIAAVKVEASAADRQDLLCGSKDGIDLDTGSGLAVDNRNGVSLEMQKYRVQMIDNTQKYGEASKTLLQAERLLNDTEISGNEALTNLRTQSETIRQIHETVFDVDEEISKSRKILKKMQLMMIKHKLILIGIISILLFLIIVAIYVEVSKNRRNRMPEPSIEPPSSTIPISSVGN
ncbi:unnamed protein product [Phytomonas sp. Hart1]|nr:unnamed protein product [Phytomonas sp. Hart1]|eukprot:CCW72259.1 unnamed protein product [Phytomonas sp. isolate Hart1]